MTLGANHLGYFDSWEPFRRLFPLGTVLGVCGVSLWPLFVYGCLPWYPGILHTRIMVQGFLFCAAAGF